jgi:EAL domain-containing protein (putative c-di-GMP-specific phosphodiesterase class I)/GGDEF domain-containing protein
LESRACKIRDFCALGMFISFDSDGGGVAGKAPPSLGVVVKIHFTLSFGGSDRPLALNARVARVMTSGLGVELIEPDPVVVAAMTQAAQTAAVPAARSGLPEVGQPPDSGKVERMAVLREVRSRLERAFNHWMEHFLNDLEPTLINYSREIKNGALQRDIFIHGQMLREKRGAIINELRVLLLEHYDSACTRGVGPPDESSDSKSSALGDALSLVETDEFEQFLAVSEAVDRAETELSRSMFELNQRLSFLFGTRIDRGNNPFGPVFLARRVGEYLRRTRPGSEVLRACMHAYHDLAVPEIKRFYEETNAYLTQSGVPLLGEAVRPRIHSAPARRRPDAGGGAAPMDSGGGAGGYGGGAYGAGTYGAPARAGGGMQGGAPSSLAAQVEQLAAHLPAGTQLMVAPVSAFQAAHTMFGLNREVQRALSGQSTIDALAATGGAPALPSYNLGEINSALRMMELTAGMENTFSASAQVMRSNLERALAAQEPSAAQSKQVKDTDWDLLELVLELFNAIVKDPHVIPEVKPYLRKLRRPVNMVAMSDKSFFEQTGHPARKLINDIARIRSVTKGPEKKSIIPDIDFIVDKVVSEGAERPEVFAEADEQLAAIIAEQEQDARLNMDELARAAEAQHQFLKSRRKDTPATEIRAHSSTMGEDWISWINRVRRMKVGDEMMLGAGAAQRLLKLAWIAEDGNSYVFADPVGQKGGSFGAQELAMQLRRGSARIIEDLPLPTVERAMVKSLENLHGRLEQQVNSDVATNLLTEKAFTEAVDQALAQARQEMESHVVALIGIGESVVVQKLPEAERADRVRMYAQRLRESVPESVSAARFSDSDFAVLVKDCTQGSGFILLEKVVEALNAAADGATGGRARVGMVPFSTEPLDAAQVIRAARTGLKLAQSSGSAVIRIVHVEEEGGEEGRISTRLSEQLRQALDNNRLKLAYQRIAPLVQPAGTPLATHLELMPAMYLQGGTRIVAHLIRVAAEQLQRSIDLDRWLIRSTMRWVVENPDKLPVNGMCVVAISPASLRDNTLAAFIGEEFIDTAAPPSRICFEIRDEGGGANSIEVTDLISSLREYGCRFLYSDFGIDPASFTRVAALKVSLVRLGRMQSRDVVAAKGDAALVKSAVEMAHFFNVPAIADFADTKQALVKLRELGIDYAQGTAVSPVEVII